MSTVKYLFERAQRLNINRLRGKAAEVSAVSKRPLAAVYLDMLWCGLAHQAGYMDYWLFAMWRMSERQRRTVLTRGRNNAYVTALNARSSWRIFDDKPHFNRLFADIVTRRWRLIDDMCADEFEQFCKTLGVFIAKPADGTCGRGVEKIDAGSVDDWAALYKRLRDNGQRLIEEVIVQHPDMERLCDSAVCTVRIVTILMDGKAHIAAAYLRIGGGRLPVDNFNSGGLLAPIDAHSGTVTHCAVDKNGAVHERHPVSGTATGGFRVPLWHEVLRLADMVAHRVPEVRYVGWDIAVTPDGATLVEGNGYPGHDIYCLPQHAPDRMGILPRFESIIDRHELKRMIKQHKRETGHEAVFKRGAGIAGGKPTA